ncbi:MAG: alpha-amylase family glycosyl hydrolase [Candidatus Heimdallarchaeota archaeon]
MANQAQWWQKAVFYQIYPRSFRDSTNNGIGDLRGIINKLDYLEELGIDGIWFSPFFPSPQEDCGYDITDFGSINPEYGTMKDFDELLKKSHKKGIKVILDIILNHTSAQHPWFLESKKDRTNEKKDWYVWRDGRGKNGKKSPNNWNSMIGGSAWEWCEERKQYYLHQFLTFQPDLNWRHPDVQIAMFNYIRFWLDKGVDGFRLDIIQTLFEDKHFKDNPRSWRFLPSHNTNEALFHKPKYTQFLPETIEVCRKLRELVNSYSPDRLLVGEAAGNPQMIKPLYGRNNDGLHLSFNFKFAGQPFSATKFRRAIEEAEEVLSEPYWPCYVFSNHDSNRLISRHKEDKKKAKLLAILLLTLRGTPFIYYGEEIGMQQVKVHKDKQLDPISKLKIWGIPLGSIYARDGCRTPMQWDDSPINAGFSTNPKIVPWLPIGENESINVKNELNDEKSMLIFFKKLLKVRKQYEPLQFGQLNVSKVSNSDLLIYDRTSQEQHLTILLNFSSKIQSITATNIKSKQVFSTKLFEEQKEISEKITLEPFEGIIVEQMK